MVSLKLLFSVVLAISFFVFVIFFGRLPALRRTPIAGLYNFICVYIPNRLFALDERLTSGKLTRSVNGFSDFMMHDRHPTVVIIFLVIMVGAEYLFLPHVWSRLSLMSQVSVLVTVILPYSFLYLACAVDPGYITPENHSYYMSLYPYDHALFHPGQICSTCKFLKPARSKHCSVCKKCIAKADHHCIFVNSCVGYGNHHWFLLLLLSTSVLTIYGGALGSSILSGELRARFPEWSVWPTHMTWKRYAAIWGWGIRQNAAFGATTLLAILCTPLVLGLTVYSFYLVYCGTSTNETLKWSDWKEDIQDGYAFIRSLEKSRQRDYKKEPICPRWPVEPEQILIVSSNGQAPRRNVSLAGEGDWERILNMRSVENLYDMGFWENLRDVFISDHDFGDNAKVEQGRDYRTFGTRAKEQPSYPQ